MSAVLNYNNSFASYILLVYIAQQVFKGIQIFWEDLYCNLILRKYNFMQKNINKQSLKQVVFYYDYS